MRSATRFESGRWDAQCEVDALIDQADDAVEQQQPDLNLGLLVEEGVDQRAQQTRPGDNRRCQSEKAARRGAFARRLQLSLLQIGEHAPAGGGIALSGLGEPDHPRGAIEQARSDMAFERSDGARHRRGRSPEPPCRSGEAALVKRTDEDAHGFQPIHRHSIFWKNSFLLIAILSNSVSP